MSDYQVLLQDRAFFPVLSLPDVRIVPTHWGAAATGGPEYAILEVYGPEAALWSCLEWLRFGVEIGNGQGQSVWWGYVESLSLDTPSVSVSLSLDDLSNSVKVEYGEGSTDYSENAASVAEFGRKQRVLSVDPVLSNSVTQRQDAELASSQQPRPVQDIRRNEQAKVTLRCVGWLKTLSWLYYSRADGLTEYVGTGSREQIWGRGVTGAEFWFAAQARLLNDTGMNLYDFEKGMKIVVTGSSSNNTTFTVAAGTTEGPAGLTTSPVNFSGETAFLASGDPSTLAWMRSGDRIHITGTSSNDGWYLVTERGPSYAAMYVKFAETFVGEGPVSPVMWRGHSISLEETPTEEKPGASVTIVVDGSQVGQQFVPATSWTATKVSVKLRKIGNPGDSVTLTIRSDSGGLPVWPPVATSTVAASSVSSNSAWTEFSLESPVALTGGTTYWLAVNRTGANDMDDYYTIAVDEDAGYGAGYLRMWSGAAWIARPVDASMIFRVEGIEETTDQISEIVDLAGQFLTGTTIDDASGVDTLQFRDGIVDALTELGDLLTLGTENSRRLLCAVEQDRSLRVWEEPVYSGTPDYVRRLDGQIMTPLGVALSPGEMIAGTWLQVETPIPPARGVNVDPTLLFVERCEYDAASMVYNITPRGAVNIWRLAVAPSRG